MRQRTPPGPSALSPALSPGSPAPADGGVNPPLSRPLSGAGDSLHPVFRWAQVPEMGEVRAARAVLATRTIVHCLQGVATDSLVGTML